MPAAPAWFRNLSSILDSLRAHPHPHVDRATVEFLFGVGRRRAQQILAPCVSDRVGGSGLADRDRLIAHLERLACGEDAAYEIRRRQKVATLIHQLRNEPRVVVEAPVSVVNQTFEGLPSGVMIQPGRITVEFLEPQEALEKLLALAMAIGNDFAGFEQLTGRTTA